ncbi:MAG: glycerol-3-phosphate responsive antiterminator [Chloroflexota bacterium]
MSYAPPDAADFIERVAGDPRCAAITDQGLLGEALSSRAPVIFILRGNGLSLGALVRRIHDANKLVAVHVDLVGGLRADRAGVEWLASVGVDAVISSHGQLMAAIRHGGMTAIHRLLLVRRNQLDTAVAAIGRSAPNIVEILPGVILPSVVGMMPRFEVPVLAGGFVRTEADVQAILSAGALGVTTTSRALWGTNGA